MLGSIAGFWISIFICVLVGISLIGALAASMGKESKPVVDSGSVLYIDLAGNIPERLQPMDFWQIIQESEEDGEALNDIVNSIRSAKSDKKIEGIYINAAGALIGTAAIEEIMQALGEFKQSDKWIYAYGDSYSQADYLICSVADSIFLNPVGSVDMHGVAMQIPFMKGLFDKIGVKMNVTRVGTFKSAVEPYISETMSEASRLQSQIMLDSIWNYAVSTVSANRKVSATNVNMWADSLIALWPTKTVLASKAVTSLKYRRSAEASIRENLGLYEDDDIPFVTPSEYMAAQKSVSNDKKHIAVLYAVGDIVDSGKGGIVGETMVPEIVALADDDNVGALVLRVNSGGGSAFASEQIWEALEYFKSKGKPFYVSMGDYAASGGYYISCGADKIYADHTTLTGSIGVFGMIPDFSGLATDKLGVTFATVQTNPNAAFPSLYTGVTPAQMAALQKSTENTYDIFTSRVAKGRGISQDSVKVIAEGRVWTGGDALRIGLVDKIGTLNATIKAISEKSGIDADKVIAYPTVDSKILDQILMEARKIENYGSLKIDAKCARILAILDHLQHMNHVQTRMPEIRINY